MNQSDLRLRIAKDAALYITVIAVGVSGFLFGSSNKVSELNTTTPTTEGENSETNNNGFVSIDSLQPTAEAGMASSAATVTKTAPVTKVVNINTANESQLTTLTGIGPVKARAILDYRLQIGAFSSLEQLMDVSGIGPATFEKIKNDITL